jgi:hypothetical protein
MWLLNIEISPTRTFAHTIYDTGTLYLFAVFYLVGYFSQCVTCFFLNKSMDVFTKEWLQEQKLKEQELKLKESNFKNSNSSSNKKLEEIINDIYNAQEPTLLSREVSKIIKKNKELRLFHPILIDKNYLELL